MPIHLLMPSLSPTMTDGTLTKWCKKEGDFVKSGEIIAEIETDKATMEVECIDEGFLTRIIIPEGTEKVPVNSLIAILLEEGEDASSISQEKILHTADERIVASPLAKRLAKEKGVDLKGIQGTGPNKRIIAADISSHEIPKKKSPDITAHKISEKKSPEISQTQNFSSSQDKPLSAMRKVIAQRLQDSKQTIPHFYVSMECAMDALMDLRVKLPIKLSINDFLLKACGLGLKAFPSLNASWHEGSIRYYETADIAVAVAIEGGLITPIVRHVENKSMQMLSHEVKQLVAKAKGGTLKPEEYQGGSFTLSNLGMYGVSSFQAIINPPQACILAVSGIRHVPVIKDGQVQPGHMTTLTLSADHRIVDGAPAAQFLGKIKELLENPLGLLL